jgi:hypothetical protein
MEQSRFSQPTCGRTLPWQLQTPEQAGGSPPRLALSSWALACGPHKPLAAETMWCTRPAREPASGTGSSGQVLAAGLRLAVSDDVDCAIVEVSMPAAAAAAGSGIISPTVRHVSSITALAYVGAGKTQRRHLLLGVAGRGSLGTAVPSGLQPRHARLSTLLYGAEAGWATWVPHVNAGPAA